MKRLLFHYPILNTGGAEISTLRMTKALADRGWKITLVLTTGGGALEGSVDQRINVIRLRPRPFGRKFFSAPTLPGRILALPDLAAYLATCAIGLLRMTPFFFRKYEAAAVLLMGTSSFFVRRVVCASVRLLWIRNDLISADPTGRIRNSLKAAATEIDRFICVSEVARQSLIKVVPEAARKTEVIYNILDAETMRRQAVIGQDPYPARVGEGLRILTVCRLKNRAKGLLRMVRVCRRLADANYRFQWFVVGDGPDRALCKKAIADADVDDRLILLGRLANPFPAYVGADFIAMLSFYEGLSGAINEARVLERPVIATRVSGVNEQITNDVNGLIVDNDENAIVTGMSLMIKSKQFRERLAKGGYPNALLDDTAKLDRLEYIFNSIEQ